MTRPARIGVLAALAVAAAAPGARAEPLAPPCADALADPVTAALRTPGVDVPRAACPRAEAAVLVHGDALIDTPGFRGVLGGELRALLRARVHPDVAVELGVRAVRGRFVQNAVTKVTGAQLGPLTVGGVWAPGGDRRGGLRLGVAGLVELPYTRDDVAALHTSGALAVVATGALARRVTLHARLGATYLHASSTGGATTRVAPRAGADLAWRLARRRLALHGGVDVQAGWYGGGLDHVLVRAGAQGRLGDRWRLTASAGVPVAGAERMTAVIDVGLVRDLP